MYILGLMASFFMGAIIMVLVSAGGKDE